MEEKLDTLTKTSEIPIEGNPRNCERLLLNCPGSKDPENLKGLCSVEKGVGCIYKAYCFSSDLQIGGYF